MLDNTTIELLNYLTQVVDCSTRWSLIQRYRHVMDGYWIPSKTQHEFIPLIGERVTLADTVPPIEGVVEKVELREWRVYEGQIEVDVVIHIRKEEKA